MTRLHVICLCAFVSAGCTGDLTELIVVADTDLSVPVELDSVRFDVDASSIGGTSQSSLVSLDGSTPAFVGIVHQGGPLGPIEVTAVGLQGGAERLQRTARVQFVEGETRVLRLDLFRACVGETCADGETCGETGCRSTAVAAAELLPWTGSPPRIGAGTDGGVADSGVDGGRDEDAGGDAGRMDGGCVAAPESCNDADDDCDGQVDEDFDLHSSATQCGACDNDCGAEACLARACAGAPVSVAVGGTHACALDAAGVARCWGDNGAGQLGDGSGSTQATPVAVSGLAPAAQVVAGDLHSCALTRTTEVWCWGSNTEGQLGDGTRTDRPTPVMVTLPADPMRLTAGGEHTCALLTDGSVRCWGANALGQLGDGTTTRRTSPVSVMLGMNAVDIAAGRAHSCAALTDGTAACWGDNNQGQVGTGVLSMRETTPRGVSVTGAVQVVAGSMHSCIRQGSGAAFCWGRNNAGQAGSNSGGDALNPRQVVDTDSRPLNDAIFIAAGADHNCVVREAGVLSCWGAHMNKQLGVGSPFNQRRGTVELVGIDDASRIAAGATFTCARTRDRGVLCWGENAVGLGDAATTTSSEIPVVALTP